MSINQWRIGRIGPGKQNLIGVPGVAAPTGYRYWRMLYDMTVGGVEGLDFLEAEFLLGGVDQTGSGTASASSYYVPQDLAPSKAFDDIITGDNSRWATDFSNTWPQWLAYDFGTPVDIDAVSITAYIAERAPANISVQHSENGTDWTESYSASGGITPDWSSGVRRVFSEP
jgi:hypothetical protein